MFYKSKPYSFRTLTPVSPGGCGITPVSSIPSQYSISKDGTKLKIFTSLSLKQLKVGEWVSDTLGAHHSTVKLRPQLFPTPNNSPWTKRPSFELPQEPRPYILFRWIDLTLLHLSVNKCNELNKSAYYLTRKRLNRFICNVIIASIRVYYFLKTNYTT